MYKSIFESGLEKRYISLYESGSNLLASFPIVMKEITEVFNENNISFCFIGGAIVYEYGYRRMTEDLDLLIDEKDKEKFYNLEGIYFKPKFQGAKKKFIWNNKNIPFDIIFSGEPTTSGAYKTPNNYLIINNGIPKLSLQKLLLIKLKVGIADNKNRQLRGNKDLLDVQQLIFLNNLDLNYLNKENLNQEEEKEWIKLWNNAQKLKDEENLYI